MRGLIGIIRQLLPPVSRLVAYWSVTLGLLLVVQWGLVPDGPNAARFWGLPLVRFGISALEIMRNVYWEMSYHVWTLGALPFACFVGLGPLVRTFRGDFQLFLRHSQRSRGFIELGRLLAVLMVVAALSLPFVVGGILCLGQVWFDWAAIGNGLAGCAGLLLFLCLLVYALAGVGLPGELATAGGVAIPFLLTGVAAVWNGTIPLHESQPVLSACEAWDIP